MNSVSQITFHPTALSIILSCIAIIAVVCLAIRACQQTKVRHQSKVSFRTLEALRVLVVVFAVVLLNQPEWIEKFQPNQKPTVLMLSDNSRSMSTKDVEVTDGLVSRSQALESFFSKASLQSDSGNYSIVRCTLAADQSDVDNKDNSVDSPDLQGGMTTDFSTPIEAALLDYPNLRAIVLASDGDWNSGRSPSEVALKLSQRKIPIYAIPFGSLNRLPDIELVAAEVPTFGILGKAIRIPIVIESSFPRATVAEVNFEASDGHREQKEIRISPMGRTIDSISWTPQVAGDLTVSISIPHLPEDQVPNNNQQLAAIAIRTEKLKVLVVESTPRWEYRYLRNALSRDPGVDVSCLLFHPGLSKVGGGNRDYIQAFPNTQEELSKYDVVFLGDVGIEPGQLTVDDARSLKGLVEQQASGLVFLPGPGGRQLSLVDTLIGDLCPVLLDHSQPSGWGSRTPSRMELTEQGRRSLLTRLAESSEENLSVWENLPGFQWYAPVVRAKAGSETLAVHQDASGPSGRIPLLVTQTRGAGKVLYLATDGAWRWRKGVEDKYHYRFWGQVVRWMAYQRNMAKGDSMRLYYSPEQPRIRQTVFATANAQAASGEPLMNGNVALRIESPSGQVETLRMNSDGGDWGAYATTFTPLESGSYKVTVQCEETEANLEANILVQGGSTERIGRPARPEVLEEMARISSGKLLAIEDIETIPALLESLPVPTLEIRRLPIWSSPWSVATLIILATSFWIGRKMLGLL